MFIAIAARFYRYVCEKWRNKPGCFSDGRVWMERPMMFLDLLLIAYTNHSEGVIYITVMNGFLQENCILVGEPHLSYLWLTIL